MSYIFISKETTKTTQIMCYWKLVVRGRTEFKNYMKENRKKIGQDALFKLIHEYKMTLHTNGQDMPIIWLQLN